MSISGQAANRRQANSAALSLFTAGGDDASRRTVREGVGNPVYTVGYERRDIGDLIECLQDAGIDLLVDVRERPMSRKPDFRRRALEAACTDAGIEYQSWPSLGSTQAQRDRLKETGDIRYFMRGFRAFAARRQADLERLAEKSQTHTIALLCYERCHDECHRSVVADLVADECGCPVNAIL